MLFCPCCANHLIISDETGTNTWVCQTCPYQFPITKQITARTHLKMPAQGYGTQTTHGSLAPNLAICERCSHGTAFFQQLQIRSADEPMTIYKTAAFRCGGCGNVWREN
ncbi:hypothetical protein BV25DRAFT_1795498 [Artomyces pyxidatus]|uniref:Uncharacterized protein n=1 Tax=Artomyces pyxidatus TaxID=48021 RepID=A0ACB8TG70_9AGAM|nr:hypothetical protein BV25DRAFT_1795498 [Artomyces pyxidatus]